jgi:5-methyltetrahydrofolate--homocysteine methyltransferase
MAKPSILSALRSGRILVADGAWGTALYARGLAKGECPELWCLTHPEEVRIVAADYLAAGAELVGTNSFGANRFRLEGYGLADRVAELNETAARLSRMTVGDAASVLGSMGPSGLRWGEASPEDLAGAFALQARSLAAGGVDALCVETIMDAREAAIAVHAAKAATGLEAICSYSFALGSDGIARTIAGQSMQEAAAVALDAGADILGANCGRGFDEMLFVLHQLIIAAREVESGAPIMVSPNVGVPAAVGAYPDTPSAMEAFARAAIAEGAAIVGGCCGTTAEHVRAIRRAVDDAIDRGAAEALL